MFRMKNKTLKGLEADKLRRNMWTYVILLSALGAMTFFGVCDPTSQLQGPQGSAAVVGDEVISRAEFNRAYRSSYDRYQRQFSEQFDPAALRLAHNVMKELVDDRMLYLKAVDLGMRASDAEVLDLLRREQVFKGEDGQFSEEVFDNFLRAQGYTEASFLEEVRRGVTVQKLRRFITDTAYVSSKAAELDYQLAETKLDIEYLKFDPQAIDAKPSAKEVDDFIASEEGKKRIKEYYDTNTKEFNTPEQIKARHILIAFEGARNATAEALKRSKDEAQKLANELATKVKEPGVDFGAFAKEKTDEAAGKNSGGDLGYFARDAMVKEFSDAAFALNVGDISGVVESPFGFHIIKVEDKKAAKNITLDDAQRQIAEAVLTKELRPKLAKERAEQVLKALQSDAAAAGPLLTDYKAAWQATGEIAANSRFLPGIGSSSEINDALAELSKPGELYPKAIDVRGNFYLLRLKAKKEPDMAKLDEEKKNDLAASASFSEGYALFSAYEKQIRDELEKTEKVWMNPEYLALDDGQDNNSPGG